MATVKLTDRVKLLDAEVARLKNKIELSEKEAKPWTEKIWGIFANDPAFEEAMRLGREYRESQSVQPRRASRRSNRKIASAERSRS